MYVFKRKVNVTCNMELCTRYESVKIEVKGHYVSRIFCLGGDQYSFGFIETRLSNMTCTETWYVTTFREIFHLSR